MNILHVHQHFATREGAGATGTYELARHMIAHGHTVTIVAGNRQASGVEAVERQVIDGIEVLSLGGFYSNHLSAFGRMRQFLRFMVKSALVPRRRLTHRPDLILASSTPLTTGVSGWVLARRFRVPMVFEVQDLWPRAPIELGYLRNPLLKWLAWRLERWCYRRATSIVALSPGMTQGVLDRGTPSDKVTTIPNASDTELFNPAHRDRSLLDRFGVGDRFVAVHGGSMGEANGLDYLVKAAAVLQRRGVDDIVIMLCGYGGTRPKLEAMVAEQGLENVIFTGSIPRRELGAIVSSVDAAIVSFANFPILATNSPNKMFDGMAAGLPIIVNSPGWTRDLVLAEQCGTFVDPADPEQLADALCTLRDDPDLRERQGRAARRVAETQFARTILNERYRGVLERAAGIEHVPSASAGPRQAASERVAAGASTGQGR